MHLAPGDSLLLELIFEYRYVQSGQLKRLTGRSGQVIRRRLRRLAAAQFVVILTRSPTEQAAYALGPLGFEWIAHQLGVAVSDLPFSRKVSQDKTASFFWKHTLLVNDVLIAFRMALEEHPDLTLLRSIQEWEMENPRARAHHRRYRLSERLEEGGNVHAHRPDACLLLGLPRAPGEMKVAVFIEADRNTQSMTRIRKKLAAYRVYWKRQRHAAVFGAVSMRVLFVLGEVKTDRRIESMQRELEQMARPLEARGEPAEPLTGMFRFARSSALAGDIVHDPVWRTGLGPEPAPFYRGASRQLCLPLAGVPSIGGEAAS